MQYEIAFAVKNKLGEGPIWDEITGELIWFDIIAQCLFIGNIETKIIQTFPFDEPVSAAFLSDSDQLFIAAASGLTVFDRKTGNITPYLPIEADNPLTRANDSRLGPGNAIWFGTMGRKHEAEAGSIYHIQGRICQKLYDHVSIPNATCFSPDGRTAYFCDTVKRIIMQVEINPETGLPTASPRIFVDLGPEHINPDGAVIDAEGCLWNAQWGAGRVACYDSTGKFRTSIKLPATQLTCPAFGGADLKTLFVTSACDGVSQRSQPEAGAVFAIKMEIAGLNERRLLSPAD